MRIITVFLTFENSLSGMTLLVHGRSRWLVLAAGGNRWLDFMAFHPETAAAGIPLGFLAAAIGLVAVAWLGEIGGGPVKDRPQF